MTYGILLESCDVGMRLHQRFPSQQKMKVQKPLLSDIN